MQLVGPSSRIGDKKLFSSTCYRAGTSGWEKSSQRTWKTTSARVQPSEIRHVDEVARSRSGRLGSDWSGALCRTELPKTRAGEVNRWWVWRRLLISKHFEHLIERWTYFKWRRIWHNLPSSWSWAAEISRRVVHCVRIDAKLYSFQWIRGEGATERDEHEKMKRRAWSNGIVHSCH